MLKDVSELHLTLIECCEWQKATYSIAKNYPMSVKKSMCYPPTTFQTFCQRNNNPKRLPRQIEQVMVSGFIFGLYVSSQILYLTKSRLQTNEIANANRNMEFLYLQSQ